MSPIPAAVASSIVSAGSPPSSSVFAGVGGGGSFAPSIRDTRSVVLPSLSSSSEPFALDLSTLMGGGPLNDPCRRHLRRVRRRRTSSAADAVDKPFYKFQGTVRTGQLYCRTGFFLQIHDDGRINGTRRRSSFGVLEFISVAIGLVAIRGKATENWLCMNSKGKLYGRMKYDVTECVFLEQMLENYYNTYASCAVRSRAPSPSGRKRKRRWYVALSKKGRPRRGNKSRRRRKNAQFLVYSAEHDDDTGVDGGRRLPPLDARWRGGGGRLDARYSSRFGTQYYVNRWREREKIYEIYSQWRRQGKIVTLSRRRRGGGRRRSRGGGERAAG